MYIFLDGIRLLKARDKIKLVFLFFLIIINVFFEMLGIGLVFPLLGFLISDKFFLEYIHYLNFLEFFFTINKKNLVIFLCISLIVIFLFKNLISFILSFYKYKFTYDLLNYFSVNLFDHYIKNDYEYFTKNNSSIPIRNIDNVAIFTEGLNQFLFLLIEVLFLICILFFLFYINFTSTIVLILIILIAFFAFKSLTKKKLILLGDQRQIFLKKKMQTVYESMQSIKEIKIFFREIFFKEKFQKDIKNYSYTGRMFETYQSIPKIWLEMLGIISLSSILIIMIKLNDNLEMVISTIAIFGISAVRIVPSLNRFLSSFQFLTHYISIIETTIEELKLHDKKKTINHIKPEQFIKKFIFNESIKISNLNFSFGKKNILKNLNLEIKKNETIGIIGKTGSGKSTLANILVGVLRNNTGSIIIDKKYELNEVLNHRTNLFGYIPQSTFLLDDTIKKNISFGEDEKDFNPDLFWECLKIAKIDEYIKDLDNKENTIVGERGIKFSGGQVQRLGIARALYRRPQILILDEATSSLDLDTEELFIDAISQMKNKITMIIITHRLSSLKICDKIYKIDKGNITLNS